MRLIGFILLISTLFSCSSNNTNFITLWKTDNPGGSNDNQITIFTNLKDFPNQYNFNIDWGDGTEDHNVGSDITHTYSKPGIYEVKISGDFPHFTSGRLRQNSDALKLLSVNQWGKNKWKSMRYSFYNCQNMIVKAKDSPDLTNAVSMSGMFHTAKKFNQNINHWDVSNIKHMSELFVRAGSFNQPLNKWETSNLITTSSMFYEATLFNQDISSWDTSKIKNMSWMFYRAKEFNRNINNWDVSNVELMEATFGNAKSFNQPLNNWNVSNVTSMNWMFLNANKFNQPINNWNVSNVTSFMAFLKGASVFNQPLNKWDVSSVEIMGGSAEYPEGMFTNAISFDQDLSNWKLSSIMSMDHMFSGVTLSTQNYDAMLISFLSQQPKTYIMFHGGNSMFTKNSKAEEARKELIEDFNWWIYDAETVETIYN